ncbi:MAG: tRNA (guanosine(46)-N7)-methyltransferase TrmB [Rikenellaceae bacterium]|jgi:tRNA (guanine-N7-)-methyltransferase|nr:tRNA (guanosine(46)-N7)-methyltransferase TrmB [Rikenellaceae bacterium]
MGKNKIRRFQENETFSCLVQPEFESIFHRDHPLKGRWRADFFGNEQPICLELGCGRGEYTVALGQRNPAINYIGVDIKGARMWRGAKTAHELQLANVGFLRTRIEFIDSFFAPGEVDEIWITFPDPQLKKGRAKKRLTAPGFLALYARFLKPGGTIHLKTDSQRLHEYTRAVIAANDLPLTVANADIYGTGLADETLSVKTAYEARYLSEGLPITYLQFGLGGKNAFTEPDFEPDRHESE